MITHVWHLKGEVHFEKEVDGLLRLVVKRNLLIDLYVERKLDV